MIKIAFIDFQDSFSFNIVQSLMELGFEVKVYTYPYHHEAWGYDLVVLGPGPGHPDEYSDVLPLIKERLESSKKIFGVCLGHQLIWRALDFPVVKSQIPLHGQKVKIKLTSFWMNYLKLPEIVSVQRYNSLVVQIKESEVPQGITVLFSQDELQISKGPCWLSYQFHPESVGTSFQKSFFLPLTEFGL